MGYDVPKQSSAFVDMEDVGFRALGFHIFCDNDILSPLMDRVRSQSRISLIHEYHLFCY